MLQECKLYYAFTTAQHTYHNRSSLLLCRRHFPRSCEPLKFLRCQTEKSRYSAKERTDYVCLRSQLPQQKSTGAAPNHQANASAGWLNTQSLCLEGGGVLLSGSVSALVYHAWYSYDS